MRFHYFITSLLHYFIISFRLFTSFRCIGTVYRNDVSYRKRNLISVCTFRPPTRHSERREESRQCLHLLTTNPSFRTERGISSVHRFILVGIPPIVVPKFRNDGYKFGMTVVRAGFLPSVVPKFRNDDDAVGMTITLAE